MDYSVNQSTRHRKVNGGARLAVVCALAVGVLAATIGAGWWGIHKLGDLPITDEPGAKTPQWAVAQNEQIDVTIIAEGNLSAKEQVPVVNTVETYNISIESLVEEGTWVKEGDWLLTLSAPGVVIMRDEMEAMVRDAGEKLVEAKRSLEIEKEVMGSAEAEARLKLELAGLAHKRWEQGEHKQKVLELNLAFEKASREFEQAQIDVTNSKELYEQDFISKTELRADEVKLIEAESAKKVAELGIAVYNNYDKVMTEKEKLSAIKQAREELERTIRKNENSLQLLKAKVLSSEDGLKQATARFEQLNQMVDALEVRAPASGMVIYSSTLWGGRRSYYTTRAGNRSYPGDMIMVLSDTTQLVANLYVHESRINEVEVGQRVVVRLQVGGERVLEGEVIEKKTSATQGAGANPHMREYQVLVKLPPNLGEDIRPGMLCSGEISIREIPEALAVPIQAVHTEGKEHFVYVPAEEDGKIRRQPIEMGSASDTLVQVKAGVEVGTRVLLRTPYPGELLLDEPKTPQTVPAADKEAEDEEAV